MKRGARSLARLNGRILRIFSQRTTTALRAALPLRLALPHLEPILALNVTKEASKDTLVILRACELAAELPADWSLIQPQLLQATKEIDRMFLARVGKFPVGIVIRYEEIAPIRARRMKLLYDAAQKILTPRDSKPRLRGAMHTTFTRDEFTQLLYELFRLYADETRSLSRSVRLPGLLVPLRERIAQELFNVMLRVARPLASEIAAMAYRPPPPGPRHHASEFSVRPAPRCGEVSGVGDRVTDIAAGPIGNAPESGCRLAEAHRHETATKAP
ncbi:MAG: hypothetical protein WCI19_14440 [Betaproteobacteria bacterium]